MRRSIVDGAVWLHAVVSNAAHALHQFFHKRLGFQIALEFYTLVVLYNSVMAIPSLASGQLDSWQSLWAVFTLDGGGIGLMEVMLGRELHPLLDWSPIIIILSCCGVGVHLLEWAAGHLCHYRRNPGDALAPSMAAWGIVIGMALHLLFAAILMDYFQRGNLSTLLYSFWPWILAYALLVTEGPRRKKRKRPASQAKTWQELLRQRVFGDLAPQTT